jgi:hypothetical protein
MLKMGRCFEKKMNLIKKLGMNVDDREDVMMRMIFILQENQLYLYTGSLYQSISSSLEHSFSKDADELHNVDITRLEFQVSPQTRVHAGRRLTGGSSP